MHAANESQTEIEVDRVVRRRMVRWYNPEQLLRTGIGLIVSTLFGKHSDMPCRSRRGARETPSR
jgi:hypothetical protein